VGDQGEEDDGEEDRAMRQTAAALILASTIASGLSVESALAQSAPQSVPASPAPLAAPEVLQGPDITNTNPSAPVPGANSFTEHQAKKRLEAYGFRNVSELAKDEDGIWRGRASKNGQIVSVAVDYQGNLVAK
jgi:hypothetical protein